MSWMHGFRQDPCREEAIRHYYVSFRRILVDVSLVAFICLCLVVMRGTLILLEEIRTTRTEFIAEIAQNRIALQMQVRDLSSSLTRISVNSSVLIDRLDSQLTKARGQIHDAAATTQNGAVAERKQIQEVLESNLAPAAKAIVSAASQVEQASKNDDTAPVVVPPAQVIVQSTPNPAKSERTVAAPSPTQSTSDEKPRSNKWKQFWRIITFRKRS